MANPSYASAIVQLAYIFAQELKRFYQDHKDVIDIQHMIPSNLLGSPELSRRDVNLSFGLVTLKFEEVNEDWTNKDEQGQPKVKGLTFSVEAEIENGFTIDFLCNTSDTYESISSRFQRFLRLKIVSMDTILARMKTMLGSLEVLD